MATTLSATAPAQKARSSVSNGIVAGLGGGLIFGILMQMMGMISMIAMMMGSKSDLVGWLIHLMISAVFGLIYGVLAYRISSSWVVSGLVYGAILWVFGPLFIMPIMGGMAPFTFTGTTWMALMGHLVYGFLTAWFFQRLTK